jgi:hypothetical protein
VSEASASHSPHAGNGGGHGLSTEGAQSSYSNTQHADAAGADPSANQPAQTAGADERRT